MEGRIAISRTKSQIIQQANETLIQNRNLDAISQFFSPSYVAHVGRKDFVGGHQVVRRMLRSHFRAFEQIQVEIDVLIGASSRITWRRFWQGIHAAPYRGFPPSGKLVRWNDLVTTEIQNGLIVREWLVTDLAEKLLLASK